MYKKLCGITICIITIVALPFVSNVLPISHTQFKQPTAPKFHLDIKLSDTPKTCTIYEILPAEMEMGHLERVAKNIGMSIIEKKSLPDKYLLMSNNKEALEYYLETGVLTYTNSEKAYPTTYSKPDLPDDASTIQIAETFLKNNDFWRDNILFYRIGYNVQGIAKKSTGEVIDEWVVVKKVFYEEILGGVPVKGVGGKLFVSVGENGKVVSFIYSIRKYKPIGEIKIISPLKAFYKLQNGEGIMIKDRVVYEGKDIVINNCSLCYYIPLLTENKGMAICYEFRGYLEDTKNPFRIFVNAMD